MEIHLPWSGDQMPDKYAKYAPAANMRGGYPILSFPFSISDVPVNTKYFAWSLLDYDAVPVGGFIWIHWLATDLAASTTEIPENASQSGAVHFIQGRNSNAGRMVNVQDPLINQRYVGPQPPDQTHDYTLTVYALNAPLELENGFWYNAFRRELRGKVLAQAQVEIPSQS
jgi:Raf kinase inhibitor-like YbhB/YbcL family protein